MNNVAWTAEELSDVGLSWAEFKERGHTRSYHAWRQKRKDVGDAKVPVQHEKAVPIVDDMPGLEEARALLDQSDARLFAAYLDYHEEVNRAFPFSQDVSVGVDTTEPIGVCLMSDWHIGSEGCDLRRLKADIDLIASHPRLYVGLGGDVCDNFIIEKMASAARTQTAAVQVQWRLFRYLMQPLLESHSLLWVSSGNHDAWSERAAAIDPILASLGHVPVSYIGEGGYIDVRVGPKEGRHQQYTVWRKHKPTRFNSSFNRTHFLKQMLRIELPRDYDIGISEHLHDAGLETWTYRRKERVLVTCGSYKVRDRWSESIGYYSGGYGVPTIVLSPHRRKLLSFFSIADALEAIDGPSWSAA